MAQEGTQRISKGHGWLMVFVGLCFDFLPMILIVIVFALSMNLGGGLFSNNAQHISDLADKWCTIYSTGQGNKLQLSQAKRNCEVYTKMKPGVASMATKGNIVVGLLFGGAASFLLAPILYVIGSYGALVLGYVVFTIWFLFKHVNIWSISKPKRILMSAFTMFLEGIPVLNLLPGITFMVWRHVKITQVEDKIRQNALLNKQLQVVQGGRRRMPRLQRAA